MFVDIQSTENILEGGRQKWEGRGVGEMIAEVETEGYPPPLC